MNGQIYTPLDIGLDALGVSGELDPLEELGVRGVEQDKMISGLSDLIGTRMAQHPEIKSEILVAGLHLLLGEVDDLEAVRSMLVPLDRAVDLAAVA